MSAAKQEAPRDQLDEAVQAYAELARHREGPPDVFERLDKACGAALSAAQRVGYSVDAIVQAIGPNLVISMHWCSRVLRERADREEAERVENFRLHGARQTSAERLLVEKEAEKEAERAANELLYGIRETNFEHRHRTWEQEYTAQQLKRQEARRKSIATVAARAKNNPAIPNSLWLVSAVAAHNKVRNLKQHAPGAVSIRAARDLSFFLATQAGHTHKEIADVIQRSVARISQIVQRGERRSNKLQVAARDRQELTDALAPISREDLLVGHLAELAEGWRPEWVRT
jgi:hypothetical protein